MKKFFLTCIVFSLALLIGCQENLINEPESTSLVKKGESTLEDVIKICCAVQDPLSGQCNLIGEVRYTHDIMNRSMNPEGLFIVDLHLKMDSELCDMLGRVHLEWRAQGSNGEIVYVSEPGIVLHKNYNITNRQDVLLCVNYLVTNENVEIIKIWIQEID